MTVAPFEEGTWKVCQRKCSSGPVPVVIRMKFNLVDGWDDSRVTEDALRLEYVEVRKTLKSMLAN